MYLFEKFVWSGSADVITRYNKSPYLLKSFQQMYFPANKPLITDQTFNTIIFLFKLNQLIMSVPPITITFSRLIRTEHYNQTKFLCSFIYEK